MSKIFLSVWGLKYTKDVNKTCFYIKIIWFLSFSRCSWTGKTSGEKIVKSVTFAQLIIVVCKRTTIQGTSVGLCRLTSIKLQSRWYLMSHDMFQLCNTYSVHRDCWYAVQKLNLTFKSRDMLIYAVYTWYTYHMTPLGAHCTSSYSHLLIIMKTVKWKRSKHISLSRILL